MKKDTAVATNGTADGFFSKITLLPQTPKILMPPHPKKKKPPGLTDDDYYYTPEGYIVFTANYHTKRGYCCKNGCRHCPYGFKKNE